MINPQDEKPKHVIIVLQTRDTANHFTSSFVFKYESEERMKEALMRSFPWLQQHSEMAHCENLEFDFDLAGVKFQKNPNKERTERYRKTGN